MEQQELLAVVGGIVLLLLLVAAGAAAVLYKPAEQKAEQVEAPEVGEGRASTCVAPCQGGLHSLMLGMCRQMRQGVCGRGVQDVWLQEPGAAGSRWLPGRLQSRKAVLTRQGPVQLWPITTYFVQNLGCSRASEDLSSSLLLVQDEEGEEEADGRRGGARAARRAAHQAERDAFNARTAKRDVGPKMLPIQRAEKLTSYDSQREYLLLCVPLC